MCFLLVLLQLYLQVQVKKYLKFIALIQLGLIFWIEWISSGICLRVSHSWRYKPKYYFIYTCSYNSATNRNILAFRYEINKYRDFNFIRKITYLRSNFANVIALKACGNNNRHIRSNIICSLRYNIRYNIRSGLYSLPFCL